MGVAVSAGTGISVGVLVGVSVGVLVFVLVGVFVGVFVGVAVGVLVGVSVGVFVGVSVGVAVGVLVGVFVGVFVGVAVGVLVGVLAGVYVAVSSGLGRRVLVGGTGVRVGKMECVGVSEGSEVGDSVSVRVGIGVTYWEITSTVKAAIVFMFETAESTRLWGPKLIGVEGDALAPDRAIAETIQNRLKPKALATRTIIGPE